MVKKFDVKKFPYLTSEAVAAKIKTEGYNELPTKLKHKISHIIFEVFSRTDDFPPGHRRKLIFYSRKFPRSSDVI